MSLKVEDSQTPVVDEYGSFFLDEPDTEAQIVEKLGRLAAEKYPRELDFTACGFIWTQDVASAMIRCMERYDDEKLRWNQLTFYDPHQTEFFFSVVESVARLSLVRNLTFCSESAIEPPITLPFASTLSPLLQYRNGLERIHIANYEISPNSMAILAQGLELSSRTSRMHQTSSSSSLSASQPFHELSFSYNRYLETSNVEGDSDRAAEYLARGLKSNTTLTSLSLSDYLDDASLSDIVESLIGHPTLKILELGECEYGSRSIRAFHRLLEFDGCQLKELGIAFHRSDPDESDIVLDIQGLVEALPMNRSLKSLSLADHGTINAEDVNRLLRQVTEKLPNLRSLDVSGNLIEDFTVLTNNLFSNISQRPLHHLRVLDLDDNGCVEHLIAALAGVTSSDDDTVSIVPDVGRLLDAFPTLHFFGEDVARAMKNIEPTQCLAVRLHRNRCLGRLMQGGQVPISIWPQVIAKVHADRTLQARPDHRATLVYEIVQGQAFGGRRSV